MPYNFIAMEKRIKSTLCRLEDSTYKKSGDLDISAWVTKEPISFNDRFSGERIDLAVGDVWGGLFDCAWMNFKGSLPAGDFSKYVLVIDISGEGLVVDSKGVPVQGITTYASMYDFKLGMPGKKIVYLDKLTDGSGNVDFWIDAGNNDLFGNLKNNGTIAEAYIAESRPYLLKLYYDFEVLNELRTRIPENKARFHNIRQALYDASLKLSDYNEDEALIALEHTAKELNRRNGDHSLIINAIGHSHIDLAWLWPVRETIRKAARTFSTVLMNMERYPEYIFGASQPQLYQWTKENYPELYSGIKKAVSDGRWELQGAMWVESDTNLTGGEALVRQMLYGKKFFRDEFNADVRNVWLPDVFGYSAALPQIMKKSDVDYFMTIKISWCEFNKFPHHTFIWKGLDGTEVIAHMPPEGTYNSSAAPRALMDSEENFADKSVSDECLLLYGIGDGGGGPGEEHLERLKREKNLQGLAPVRQGFASEFFDRISINADKYKTWHGELYLEHHRGTYTSEGRNKRYNKLMELLLRDAEIIGCISGAGYEKDRIEEIWKEVLLYQFHDILPGSSIQRVYDESLSRYELLEKEVMESAGLLNNGKEQKMLIANTLSWKRSEWIRLPDGWKYVSANPMSCVPLGEEVEKELYVSINEEANTLENAFLKVIFNDAGNMRSILDKSNGKEIIKSGESANVIKIYKDEGDAWDFPHDYREHPITGLKLTDTEYRLDGPEAIRINRYEFYNSQIIQEIVLTDDSRRIDIRNKIDWHEINTMMRSSFPLSVCAKNITCGIQFGYIDRPSIDNTLWDMAKLEVCGQDYVDVTQGDYGIAIMSDYKYGYSSSLDTIEICLLRSTAYPDKTGDIGIHEFTYSIFPHSGNHVESGVIQSAMELSRPLRLIYDSSSRIKDCTGFAVIDRKNIFIETIKLSEDGNGIIVRMYEAYGYGTSAEVLFNTQVSEITEVNLIEREINEIKCDDNKVNLDFGPFEIKTLRII